MKNVAVMQIPFKNVFFKKNSIFLSLFICPLIRRTLGIEKNDSTKFWLPPAKAKPMEGNHGQRLYKQAYLPNQEKY